MSKDLKEMYLDGLLEGRNVSKVSAEQYIVNNQDVIPLVIVTAYLDSVKKEMVINDGKILGFKRA